MKSDDHNSDLILPAGEQRRRQPQEEIRSTVRVSLYRLDTEGVLVKSPRKYALKKEDGKKHGNE